MRIVVFITEAAPAQRVLNHIGEPSTAPRIAPARAPPPWDEDDFGAVFLDEDRFTGDPLSEPEPKCQFEKCQFDQRISW